MRTVVLCLNFSDVALSMWAVRTRENKTDAELQTAKGDRERDVRERVEDGRLNYAAARRWTSRCLVAAD
jgi:hypothetical protein